MAKCTKCKKRKAVIELKYMKTKFCKICFVKYYEAKVRKIIRSNKMLNKRDKVAVGVSGGKDSLVLLYLLNKFGYKVIAISIDEGIKGYRDKSLEYVIDFCRRKIPLYIYKFEEEFGFTLDDIAKESKRPPCSYCGVFRRKLLNKYARELGCNKVATAHNLDDEVQSIVMNFFRSELQRSARMGPVTGVIKHRKFVTRIKPLRERMEKENVTYALIRGIDYYDGECPYIVSAYRVSIRDFLSDMENKYPGTKIGILHSFDRMLPFLQKYYKTTKMPNQCEICGELSKEEICKACEMLKELS